MAKRGSPLVSFAAGVGAGFLNAKRQEKLDGERAEDRAMAKEENDFRREERQTAKNLRMSLADAARPVTVEEGAGGMVKPESMDNRDVGLPENAALPNEGLSLGGYRVKDKAYAAQPEAAAAAATQNSPEAVALRQGAAYRQAGQPVAALDIEQKQAAITSARVAQAKKMKEEGFLDAARVSRTGDAQAVFDTFNKTGTMKLDGVPTVTPVERDLPGIGKVTTFDYVGKMTGPDGQPREIKVNSHDLSMQTLPFEKALELQRKGADSDNKATYQQGLLDNKIKQLELTGQIAEAKALAAAAKSSAGGGAIGREERLRYTSLFQESGRRAGEAQKALTALQKDPEFSRGLRRDPNGPQAQELGALRESLKTHNDERALYQGLLAGSQGATPSLADAKPRAGAAAGAPKSVKTKAERDALPKGTRYTGPDGQSYVKQ